MAHIDLCCQNTGGSPANSRLVMRINDSSYGFEAVIRIENPKRRVKEKFKAS